MHIDSELLFFFLFFWGARPVTHISYSYQSNIEFRFVLFFHLFLSSFAHKISPRSTGSASSGNSLYKRKYSPHIDPHRDTPSSQSILAANAKRIAYNTNNNSVLYCIYCTKNDFENLEQLHAHVQQMHAFVLQEVSGFVVRCPLFICESASQLKSISITINL